MAHVDLLELVSGLVVDDMVNGIHDIADGGLAVTVAEMAIASGVGAALSCSDDPASLFGESSSRVVLSLSPAHRDGVLARAAERGVPAVILGEAGGDRLRIGAVIDVPVEALAAAHRDCIPRALSG